MIPVSQALDQLFSLVSPLPVEEVPLTKALGRVLARPLAARHAQPPFDASAMDGYALRDADAQQGAQLRVIGQSAAGHPFAGSLGAGEAVRIFTGAPVPQGADRVLLQEDVEAHGDSVTLTGAIPQGRHIRPAGNDFSLGDALEAPRILAPADIALAAAMGHAVLPVIRRPDVAILATGDELVPPGRPLAPGQITASNSYGLHALIAQAGGHPRLLPIADDSLEGLAQSFALAQGADLIVTIGGASVGDHDLVAQAAGAAGVDLAFHKVAMRPGKPLMAGRMQGAAMIGLPGNPVSAMVCGHVFLVPVLRAMLGLPAAPAPRQTMPLAEALPANGPREHYLRARIEGGQVQPLPRQDSALLSVLAQSDALIVQPPGAGASAPGEMAQVIALRS
ncbi:gephyrin-like molybdotransferase Glp [Pseudoroseicyclus aestuarii]|uniref:Molybdopterin molybdenumtransferase n=1 Tax=Pseudoroseicyclus aestuarii TaxID=1795041 RepID=A0A318SP56_9RHOB|nr:gephyrin-like molybdotransferase Glp [Pseudoroseicyclus aestuarii]PYE81375.1 molybdopterin molybdotransferase [Pseudoroseicyclus aestuarii]